METPVSMPVFMKGRLFMPRYDILPLAAPLPTLTGRVFDPESEPFCDRPFAPIDRYAWPGDYQPEARAWAAWSAAGLQLLLCAREETVSAKVTAFGGAVWEDSCLECFLRPFDGDPRYLNIETNAAGAMLIGLGAGREGRTLLAAMPEGMHLSVSRHAGGWWAVAYTVPSGLIRSLFGRELRPGDALRGNFYCCDETIHPHFGSWSPITAPQPDFHRPECFGELVVSGK